jgi:Ni,Fe-hydrogenase III large subunit/NADH:ubiquinone oxidoreductase subunit C
MTSASVASSPSTAARAPRGAVTANVDAVKMADVPLLTVEELRDLCLRECRTGARISALFALGGGRELFLALARDAENRLVMARGQIGGSRAFPSLTPALPQAQAFEREIFEVHGLTPEGHPWLKPLRRHRELEPESEGRAPPHPFFRVEGSGVHEVAVGPVHAGIIEPGHFRFQCQGEVVHSLEIQLGYQHRGAEAMLLASPPARRLAIAETLAGDTSIGHGAAHVRTLEGLSGIEVPLRAQVIRGLALELERLANHLGDLGALCNDVGYLPGSAYFGRLRGEFLNLTLELCGNRFGRGLLKPGGVRFDCPEGKRDELLERIARAERDSKATAEMMFDSPSVLARFEKTGALTESQAADLGLVGPAARACGLNRDVRQDHPQGIYRYAHIPVARSDSGDVFARAQVRWIEIERSIVFLKEQIGEIHSGPIARPAGSLAPDSVSVALVEGWRGEVVHVAITDSKGELCEYKVVDPSFHNWFGLAMALRENPISDFPLCNKSFNLSYCGHDL